ncbi:Glycine betaine/proline ABC transporter, permease protein [Sulfitobacter noctilucicola]|uniref:Uncharacterized protein n=1 Tax=Sulfitobacter noctilucicola TaxID=1342301 RepID=A0A7W6Q4Y2_9RHOB|nr:Glycine betaine/proline ABC transporter, permease protein [Sulfitobacter noctilucicola]MBB4175148.1 hypothetical protein [Sulfitobacter noctilucicola]
MRKFTEDIDKARVVHAGVPARHDAVGEGTPQDGQVTVAFVAAAFIINVIKYSGLLPAWLHRVPETLAPDFAGVLDTIFNFVKDDLVCPP